MNDRLKELVKDNIDTDRRMFGCTVEELEKQLADYIGKQPWFGPLEFAFSLLSDAQEQMDLNLDERARQTINRAKYMLAKAGAFENGPKWDV